MEDGTRGTARDQDAHAKSYGSISIEPKQNITNKAETGLAVAESAAAPSYRRRGVTIASAFGPPPAFDAATAWAAVLSSAPLQSRLLQQAGAKKYRGTHSVVDLFPSTVE